MGVPSARFVKQESFLVLLVMLAKIVVLVSFVDQMTTQRHVESVSLVSRPSKGVQRAQHAFREELVPHARTVLKENIVAPMTKLTNV